MKKVFYVLLTITVVLLLNKNESKVVEDNKNNQKNVQEVNTIPGTRDVLKNNSELIICSQNLANYGNYDDVKKRVRYMKYTDFLEKEKSLVQRMAVAHCDVVAVQEVLATSKANAEKVLEKLADLLSKRTNRLFQSFVGSSNDSQLSSGFIIAKDSAAVLGTHSFFRTELPKLSRGQKQRYFSRGPFLVSLKLNGKKASDKIIKVINFHFKSRSSKGGYDPSGYNFEIARMEMAEALRNIALKELKGKNDLIVMLGDRNDHYDTAAAKILTGALKLDNFKHKKGCALTKNGLPYCEKNEEKKADFVSVFIGDPQMRDVEGTLRYKKRFFWLDEILLSRNALKYAEVGDKNGDYDSGIVALPKNASDHSLIWVRLKF